ncbi:MAG: BhlA/UviB family holin-like peptide [Clostridium sp.]
METEILTAALSQGVWAGLSVFLLLYILKAQEKREKTYQDIISKITDKLIIVEEMKRM